MSKFTEWRDAQTAGVKADIAAGVQPEIQKASAGIFVMGVVSSLLATIIYHKWVKK
jgi:hypothetical protein